MSDDTVAACRAALYAACRKRGYGGPPYVDVDDAAAALARAILALSHGGPCPVCTDRALAAVRQDAP